jgi:hypothetical protein
VRGLGILPFPHLSDVPVACWSISTWMCAHAGAARAVSLAGCMVPVVALKRLEASAPIKVEVALRQFGLGPARPASEEAAGAQPHLLVTGSVRRGQVDCTSHARGYRLGGGR